MCKQSSNGSRRYASPATRVIINTYSRMWELPLRMAARMGLANPTLSQNWLTLADLDNMLASQWL